MSRYALVKLFEPFGKITLMDFLFHWTGPKRGQPRGYCFLEYSTKQVKKKKKKDNRYNYVNSLACLLANHHRSSGGAESDRQDEQPNDQRPALDGVVRYSGKLTITQNYRFTSLGQLRWKVLNVDYKAPSHEDSRKGQTSSSSNRPNLLTVMKTQKMANAR